MQLKLQCPLASSVRCVFLRFFFHIVKVIYNGHWKTRGLVNAIRAGTLTESQFLRYVSNLLCSLARSLALSCLRHLFPPCLSPTFPVSLWLSQKLSRSPSWPLRPNPPCYLLWHASINGTYVICQAFVYGTYGHAISFKDTCGHAYAGMQVLGFCERVALSASRCAVASLGETGGREVGVRHAGG